MPSRKRTSQFESAREAKEFLISKIVDEAHREGIPLSEIERKELYHSETHWTLPDMETIDQEFSNEYDRDEYEKKIKKLVRNARMRVHKRDSQESAAWSDAIRVLAKEDHYMSVMLGQPSAPRNPAVYLLRIVFVTLVLGFIIVSSTSFLESHFPILMKSVPVSRPSGYSSYRRENLAIFLWGVAVAFCVLYSLVRLIFGKDKANAALEKVMDPPGKLLGRLTKWMGVTE